MEKKRLSKLVTENATVPQALYKKASDIGKQLYDLFHDMKRSKQLTDEEKKRYASAIADAMGAMKDMSGELMIKQY